jgi:hypothetical protein
MRLLYNPFFPYLVERLGAELEPDPPSSKENPTSTQP